MRAESVLQENPIHRSGPRVVAVGGGKGGVGKSVVSTNFALALARQGKRCALIDADLGGANLHTLLGIPFPKHTLGDFLSRDLTSLQDVMVPTSAADLWLISGARALLEVANPSHAQKMKIIRQIFKLDVDYVIIDLGAGTNFNVLDFFLSAHDQVLVVVPTPTSIENAYYFLKAVFFRKLKRAIRETGVVHAVESALHQRLQRQVRYPRQLLAGIREISAEAGEAVARELRSFVPRVVINQVRRPEEKGLGEEMAIACRDFFGIEVRPLGAIRHDDNVLRAVQMRRPVLQAFPTCSFSQEIQEIARHLADHGV